jgi:hypothetical protein
MEHATNSRAHGTPLHQLRWSPSPASGRGSPVAPSRPKARDWSGARSRHRAFSRLRGKVPDRAEGGSPTLRAGPPATNLSPRFPSVRQCAVPRRAGAAQRTCGGGYRGPGSRPRRAAVRATGTWTLLRSGRVRSLVPPSNSSSVTGEAEASFIADYPRGAKPRRSRPTLTNPRPHGRRGLRHAKFTSSIRLSGVPAHDSPQFCAPLTLARTGSLPHVRCSTIQPATG